jgi:uncharacterized protein Yka (UPF0111/DUF47 family)
MTTKQAIVEILGEQDILAPDAIARSLVANDQVKYYFALLQTARAHADQPNVAATDLKAERLASRIADESLDDVVTGTKKERAGAYRIPHGPEILRRVQKSIAAMLACLPADEQERFRKRLAALEMPLPEHGALPAALIQAITSGDRKSGDSLHIVVMDAHKAINRLQASTAVETLEGARVHQLSDRGRERVKAFMAGLNRTAPLKFDHPGLGTTATEHDGRLLIQNDIGTTDAHVLVIRVDDKTVTVTYTDIHRPRLAFFRAMLEDYGLVWEKAEERQSAKLETGQYILSTGRFEAASEKRLHTFLSQLGSRIVFLIDWNKMRKRLRAFVDKKQAVSILKWAADKDYGHRALLEIGGEQALAEAVEYAAGPQLRYGVRLDQMIDEHRAVDFVKDALRLAATGLVNHRSRRNIKDEIKASLRAAFEWERLRIFDVAAEHAAIGFDLASHLVEAFGRQDSQLDRAWIKRFAARADSWERRADQLLNDARDDIKRFARPKSLIAVFEHADDAVDELEEAAALVELARAADVPSEAVARLRSLAELALAASRELVRTVECAASITRSDIRDDLDEFMRALEALSSVEHNADAGLRAFRRYLVEETADQRHIMVLRELAQAIENATDAYAHAGQALRTYLMEEVIA